MKDEQSRNRILVSMDGNAGPYIIVNEAQLQTVEDLLKENGISFTTNPQSIRVDNHESDVTIDLGKGEDIKVIQALLDSEP